MLTEQWKVRSGAHIVPEDRRDDRGPLRVQQDDAVHLPGKTNRRNFDILAGQSGEDGLPDPVPPAFEGCQGSRCHASRLMIITAPMSHLRAVRGYRGNLYRARSEIYSEKNRNTHATLLMGESRRKPDTISVPPRG